MILDAILVEIASSSAQKFAFVSKATSKATMNDGRLGQNNFLPAAGGSPGTNSLESQNGRKSALQAAGRV